MAYWKGSKVSKHLSRVPNSASEPNLAIIAQGPSGGLASSRQSSSDPRPEESSGKQKSQQAALSSPNMSRTGHFFGKIKARFRTSSLSLGVEHRKNTTDQPIDPQSLTISASVLEQPHSSYAETSTLQTHSHRDLSPPTARGNITAVSSADHASPGDHGPSSSDPQGSPLVTISAPIVHPQATEHPTPPNSTLHIPTSTCHTPALAKSDVHATILPQKSTKGPHVIEPSLLSSLVWAKTLVIAVKKLHDKNLPPLDLTNLTSQSAEENIDAVIKALNTLQEDDKKKIGRAHV